MIVAAVTAAVLTAFAVPAEDAVPPGAPPAVPTPGVLSVSSDKPETQISVDGVPFGVTPLSLPRLEPGAHALTVMAKDLPPFTVPFEIFAEKTTKVTMKLAMERKPADYVKQKEAYESAAFGTGLKTVGGLCGCGVGLPALAAGGVLPFVNVVDNAVAYTLLAGGGLLSVAGMGLCSWAILDAANAPEEPLVPRVHVVTVAPPEGYGDPRDIELAAPALDTDGKPVTKDKKADDADDDKKPDGAVDVVYRAPAVRY